MKSQALGPVRTLDAFERAARVVVASKASGHTRAAYAAELDRWLSFCSGLRVRPSHATVEVAVVYRKHLLASMLDASARRAMAALSSIYKQLLADRHAQMNPFHPGLVAWPKASSAGTPLVEDHVAERMIQLAQDRGALRDVALLRLLYDTGLRRSSVASLLRHKVSAARDGRLELRVVVKGQREVIAWGVAETAAAVGAWTKTLHGPTAGFVFPGRGDKHIHVATINKVVRAYGEAVGAPHVHPHCFRAAFVTAAFDVAEPHEVQGAAHHADLRTTLGYDRGRRGERVAEAVAEKRRRK